MRRFLETDLDAATSGTQRHIPFSVITDEINIDDPPSNCPTPSQYPPKAKSMYNLGGMKLAAAECDASDDNESERAHSMEYLLDDDNKRNYPVENQLMQHGKTKSEHELRVL